VLNIGKYLNFSIKVALANLNKLHHPYKIFLVITKSCGSRCLNCHIWREVPTNELGLDEYEKLSINLGKHLSWLNISGGEPTDRDDLIEILKIFIKNCPNLLIVNFTSNGLNQKKLIEAAEYLSNSNIPIIGINISIDGPEKMHIKLRGGEDSYLKAIASLKALRKLKNIKVHASMTLFEANSHLIEETFKEIKGHIPNFRRTQLHLNQSFHSEHYYRNKASSGETPKLQPHIGTKSLLRFLAPMEILKSIYLKNLIKFQKTKKNPIPCSSLTSNVYISEHGDLYTCTIWNQKVGSLRNEEFDLHKIMNTQKAKDLRLDISNNKCINCWSPCEAFPSILDNLLKIHK